MGLKTVSSTLKILDFFRFLVCNVNQFAVYYGKKKLDWFGGKIDEVEKFCCQRAF